MKLPILVFSIVDSLGVISLAIPSIYQINAQNSTSFVTYRNASLGFAIEHPQDWQAYEETNEVKKITDFNNTVRFYGSVSPPTFTVGIKEISSYLDTQTLTVKNKTLDQVVQQFLAAIPIPHPSGLDFKMIRQNQVVVAGNPGWKMEMTMGSGGEVWTYGYFILTIANGKIYSLDYSEKALDVPQTLPIANKMLDSFRIIPIEPLNTSSAKTNLTEDLTEETFELSSDTPAKQGYASMTVYNITKNAISSNDTLGYTSLYEGVEKPRTFTPEQQAAIDAKCKTFREMYSSLPVKDRNWYLANC